MSDIHLASIAKIIQTELEPVNEKLENIEKTLEVQTRAWTDC